APWGDRAMRQRRTLLRSVVRLRRKARPIRKPAGRPGGYCGPRTRTAATLALGAAQHPIAEARRNVTGDFGTACIVVRSPFLDTFHFADYLPGIVASPARL